MAEGLVLYWPPLSFGAYASIMFVSLDIHIFAQNYMPLVGKAFVALPGCTFKEWQFSLVEDSLLRKDTNIEFIFFYLWER